jgi:prepilin-type N-terminal cleavage/methylation domain-containing protein
VFVVFAFCGRISSAASRGSLVAVRLFMPSARGFSLLEVLIATTVVAVALTSLAQVFVVSAHANSSARAMTVAALLALQKMEQLRSFTWSVDAGGMPISDARLAPSASDALRVNTAGFFDFVDGAGRSLGQAAAPPVTARYLRRWSIEPLPADADDLLVVQVLVTQRFHRSIGADGRRHQDEARIVCVRTRKAV